MATADDHATHDPTRGSAAARAELAAELVRIRQCTAKNGGRPLGMRPFATQLGLGPRSQSSVSDFEHGRRIPVDDIIDRYAAMPQAEPDRLRALVERARADESVGLERAEPAVDSRRRGGYWLIAAVIGVIVVVVVVVGWLLWNGRTGPDADGYRETAGGQTKTWSDPASAGGTAGAVINAGQTVNVSCRLEGFAVENGNTWWYRIADDPWSGSYYATADAFYNNGQTSGPLQGTPWFDEAVAKC